MKRIKQLVPLGVIVSVSVIGLAFAKANDDPDGLQLTATVADANGSGITGTATVSLGEDGLRGRLRAENLKLGHAYTVWLFYFEGNAQGGPGRFASTVAEDSDLTFRGSIGGLQASSGATIKLVIFDHPSLGPTNATRANNVLTPTGGSMAAQAVFSIP